MLGISLVVKESVGIIHEGKDFGDYGYVRGYNSGGMWGGLFSQPPFPVVFSFGKYSRIFSYASSVKLYLAYDSWIVYNESDIGDPPFLDISSNSL